jgi:hypothetical protein
MLDAKSHRSTHKWAQVQRHAYSRSATSLSRTDFAIRELLEFRRRKL